MRTCVALRRSVSRCARCRSPCTRGAWTCTGILTGRAIDGLPPALKPSSPSSATSSSSTPPIPICGASWRLRGELGAEDPNHFVDLDLVETPPFTAFLATGTRSSPSTASTRRRRWDACRGAPRRSTIGSSRRLTTSPRAPGRYAGDNARYLSAVLSHYIEDAHVPFHASANYDGQMTNQRGIHSRFETDLVLRNVKSLDLTLAPVTIRPIANVRDFVFDALIESYRVGRARSSPPTARPRTAGTSTTTAISRRCWPTRSPSSRSG